MALKMVKKGKSCKWKTKSNPTKPLKNELTSKRSPLLYKSGRFTPHSGQQEYQTRNIQTGTKLFEWKIQPSCFLCQLPELARRRRPFRPCNVWSETFWGILKVTRSPRGMVSHFFHPPFFVVYFSLYLFFFSHCSFSDQSITVTLSPSPHRCELVYPLEAESHCGGGK